MDYRELITNCKCNIVFVLPDSDNYAEISSKMEDDLKEEFNLTKYEVETIGTADEITEELIKAWIISFAEYIITPEKHFTKVLSVLNSYYRNYKVIRL